MLINTGLTNPIQDEDIWVGGGGWGNKPPSLKSVTHPTMIKLDIVIPCLKKIQKLYESHNTPLEFC